MLPSWARQPSGRALCSTPSPRGYPLSDGSQLLLATREWLTPACHLIWHHGVPPDETVALPKDVTPLIPESEATMTAAQIHASSDMQLHQALTLLDRARPRSSPGAKEIPLEASSAVSHLTGRPAGFVRLFVKFDEDRGHTGDEIEERRFRCLPTLPSAGPLPRSKPESARTFPMVLLRA